MKVATDNQGPIDGNTWTDKEIVTEKLFSQAYSLRRPKQQQIAHSYLPHSIIESKQQKVIYSASQTSERNFLRQVGGPSSLHLPVIQFRSSGKPVDSQPQCMQSYWIYSTTGDLDAVEQSSGYPLYPQALLNKTSMSLFDRNPTIASVRIGHHISVAESYNQNFRKIMLLNSKHCIQSRKLCDSTQPLFLSSFANLYQGNFVEPPLSRSMSYGSPQRNQISPFPDQFGKYHTSAMPGTELLSTRSTSAFSSPIREIIKKKANPASFAQTSHMAAFPTSRPTTIIGGGYVRGTNSTFAYGEGMYIGNTKKRPADRYDGCLRPVKKPNLPSYGDLYAPVEPRRTDRSNDSIHDDTKPPQLLAYE